MLIWWTADPTLVWFSISSSPNTQATGALLNITQIPFLVTVDTEADDAWRHPDRIRLDNLTVLPKFQALCSAYGVVPTYLLTYECCSASAGVTYIDACMKAGACEIGHHLHVWTTPPFEQPGNGGIDRAWLHAFQFELPNSLFQDKAETLKEAIKSTFGCQPRSHRAGRWGVDQRTISWLVQNEFLVDSSVVPGVSWKRQTGSASSGPEYLLAPPDPHRWCGADNQECLVEIPASALPLRPLCHLALRRLARQSAWLERLHKRLARPRMLRPDPSRDVRELEEMMTTLVQRGLPVQLMLHSSELLSGTSPITRTEEQTTRIWKQLERVFSAAREMGLLPMGLSDAASSYDKQNLQAYSPVR